MRAVRLHGIGQLKFEHLAAEPCASHRLPLAADEVRIRVEAAGICGSDLHNYRTGQWISRLPVVPGHEVAGTIVEVGRRVSCFSVGDSVVADSRMTCGGCQACLDGRGNLCAALGYLGEVCDGGFAEFMTLHSARLLRVPAGIPARIAALTEPLSVALHVVRRLAPVADSPIVIAGAGPIGGLVTILLAHLGFGPLIVVERNAARAALVASLTGARIADGEEAALKEAAAAEIRFGVEATGSSALLTVLLRALTRGGRVAMVGLYKGESAIDLNRVVESEIEMRGCSVFSDEQPDALRLLEPLRERLEKIVTPPIALENVPAEYARLIAGESEFLKSMVCP